MKKTSLLLMAVVTVALTFLTSQKVDAAGITLDASAEVWLREAGGTTTFENDLVSVWSAASPDGARRYGVVEFDVSSFAGLTLTNATFRLWAPLTSPTFSDSIEPIKQSAVAIDTSGGTQTTAMTWNLYQSEYSAGATALTTLGTLDFAPTSTGDLDVFIDSSASAVDLSVIEAAANSVNGKLTLVLIADEDGTNYGKSWGDGPDGFAGNDAQLVLTAVPEPNTVILIITGLIGLVAFGRKRRRS